MKNKYLPAIIWTLLLIWASSNHSSAQNTGGLMAWLLQISGLQLPETTIQTLHFSFRKSMHFFGYGTLTLLWHMALEGKKFRFWRALVICLSLASWDEWHQTQLAHRTGSGADVALDLLGGLMFLLSWHLFNNRLPENNSDKQPN